MNWTVAYMQVQFPPFHNCEKGCNICKILSRACLDVCKWMLITTESVQSINCSFLIRILLNLQGVYIILISCFCWFFFINRVVFETHFISYFEIRNLCLPCVTLIKSWTFLRCSGKGGFGFSPFSGRGLCEKRWFWRRFTMNRFIREATTFEKGC